MDGAARCAWHKPTTLFLDLNHSVGDFNLALKFQVPNGVSALFGRSGAGNTTLYFRGRRVLRHLLHVLMAEFGMGAAQEVLLAGGSAGGSGPVADPRTLPESSNFLAWP